MKEYPYRHRPGDGNIYLYQVRKVARTPKTECTRYITTSGTIQAGSVWEAHRIAMRAFEGGEETTFNATFWMDKRYSSCTRLGTSDIGTVRLVPGSTVTVNFM